MFLYRPTKSELFSPYIGHYQPFGLRVLRCEDGREDEVMLLRDVSPDYGFVRRLADLLTANQLDPIHLLDVIEDSI